MLKLLRNKDVMKKIYIVLALIIIPAFVLWGVGSTSKNKSGPSYAGVMYGKKISLEDYGKSWRAVKNEAIMRYPNFNEISEQLDIDGQAWDRLILLKEAEKQHIKASDADVIKTIQNFGFLSRSGRFDNDAYNRILKNVFRISPRDFEEDIRDSLKITRLISSITENVNVTDDEVLEKYKEENEKIKILYVTRSSKDFADKADVTEKETEEYYKTHSLDFKMPERVNIEFIEFAYPEYMGGITITDDRIKAYYGSHTKEFERAESVRARHILVKDADRAEDILKSIKGGRDFAGAAKEFSEDSTKENGGDLGYFEKGRMVPEFENAAFSLNPGEVSNIIKTQFGYHIIKVEDKKPADTETLDEVKDKIKSNLLTEQAKSKAYADATRAENAVRNGTNFARAAQDFKKPTKKTGFFSKQDIIPSIGWNPHLLKAAFSLKIGETSPLISPDNVKSEANYIIKVIDKKEAGVPSLDEIKDNVKNKVKLDKMNAMAKESMDKYGEAIMAEMKTGASFKDAATAAGLTIEESEYITRADYINDIGPAADIKEVFSYKAGEISPTIFTPRSSCIVQLEDIKPIDQAEFEKAKKEFKQRCLETKKSQTLDEWFSALKLKAAEERSI